ncbi:unnamed protein product, partial [Medioppia subpectinata]
MLNHLVGRSSLLNDTIGRHNNRIVILLNNTGGLSLFELNIIVKETVNQLQTRKLCVERIYLGCFMTSFSMSGVSLSAMAVDDRILQLLDSPSASSAWTQLLNTPKVLNRSVILQNPIPSPKDETPDYETIDGLKFGRELFVRAIELSCKALISSEKHLNELDTELGDGDCGSTLSGASKLLLKLITEKQLKPSFFQLSHFCEANMGGTSGAIYSLMFTAASQAIRANVKRIDRSYDYIDLWRDVIKYSLQTITQYSFAKPGDRSMLESTASMSANVGRASYVNKASIARPDPGAIAVSIWIDSIAQAFNEFANRK